MVYESQVVGVDGFVLCSSILGVQHPVAESVNGYEHWWTGFKFLGFLGICCWCRSVKLSPESLERRPREFAILRANVCELLEGHIWLQSRRECRVTLRQVKFGEDSPVGSHYAVKQGRCSLLLQVESRVGIGKRFILSGSDGEILA